LTVNNYIPRDVGVLIPVEFQGLPITVEMISLAGSNGSDSGFFSTANLVFASDSAKISNAAPGDYRFKLPDLPFVSGGQQEVVVNSAVSAASSLTTAFQVGAREARYIDIRDFMGQNLRHGITAAVTPSAESVWNSGQGDWKTYSNIKVSLNSAGNQLTVRAVSPSSQSVQATLPVTDSRVDVRGKEGNSTLYRIQATPSEIGFTPVTSSSSTSSSSIVASGEGETPVTASLNPSLVDQAIQQVKNIANMDDVEALAKRNSNAISTGYRRGFRTN
jgi:large repetitive protein